MLYLSREIPDIIPKKYPELGPEYGYVVIGFGGWETQLLPPHHASAVKLPPHGLRLEILGGGPQL